MIHTFYYKQKLSSDLGLIVSSIIIGAPISRKTEVTVPFRSSSIDMEKVVGYPTFDDRTITVKFWKRIDSREAVKACQSELNNWLLSDTTKSEFVDSDDEDYVYQAYCTGLDFSESTNRFLKCAASFKANPYKIDKKTGKGLL